MRLWFVKRWTSGFIVFLSLAAPAAAAHAAAPPSRGKAKGGGKAVSRPSQAVPAPATPTTRRGPLIDPDGR